MSELTTSKNYSFFNFRGEKINKYVQNNIVKVPKGAIKIDDYYYYEGLADKKFTIVEPVDEVEITLESHLLKKHFKLPYCSTVHSVQG